MKYPAVLLAALLILLIPATADRAEARGPELTIKQIMENSSRAKALAVNRNALRAKPGPKQLKVLELRADKLRKILRQPVRGGIVRLTAEQAAWAGLIAPLNRCTDLVRKVCGVGKQCAAASTCGLTVQLLDLYNSQPTTEEKYSLEESCIVALDDDIIFPSCEP